MNRTLNYLIVFLFLTYLTCPAMAMTRQEAIDLVGVGEASLRNLKPQVERLQLIKDLLKNPDWPVSGYSHRIFQEEIAEDIKYINEVIESSDRYRLSILKKLKDMELEKCSSCIQGEIKHFCRAAASHKTLIEEAVDKLFEYMSDRPEAFSRLAIELAESIHPDQEQSINEALKFRVANDHSNALIKAFELIKRYD